MTTRQSDSTVVRLRLGGARVDVSTTASVLAEVDERLGRPAGGKPLFLASANVNHVRYFGSGSGRETAFDDDEAADWLVLLDGMPLVWRAQRLLATPVPLLAGSDLIRPLLAVFARHSARLGILGGSRSMHRIFDDRLTTEFPDVRLVGTWSPDRAELDSPDGCRALAAAVAAAGVDALVVALGKPRQERFLLTHGADTGAAVALAFGAAADFFAGTTRRAPEQMRAAGMEWCFRLAMEPRRLGRRYLVEGPVDASRLLVSSGLWLTRDLAVRLRSDPRRAGFDDLMFGRALPRTAPVSSVTVGLAERLADDDTAPMSTVRC